jgi:hypothetical protein
LLRMSVVMMVFVHNATVCCGRQREDPLKGML